MQRASLAGFIATSGPFSIFLELCKCAEKYLQIAVLVGSTFCSREGGMDACAIMKGIMVTEQHGEEMESNSTCRDVDHTSGRSEECEV